MTTVQVGYITLCLSLCVSGLPHVSSKSSDEEKEVFLARVEWLPVTSRSHGSHRPTYKYKISIMMAKILLLMVVMKFTNKISCITADATY